MSLLTTADKILQYERLKGLLERVTYKPGYHFRLPPFDNQDYFRLYLDAVTKDATAPGKPFMVEYHMVNWYDRLLRMNDHELLQCIYRMAIDTEIHEAEEWFRIDGKHLVNPHKEQPEELWQPG
jgi:hypothetical protein